MNLGLRDRRLRNEWDLLQEMGRANPSTLEILGGEPELFRIVLHRTRGFLRRGGQNALVSSHPAEIRLPRFFPSLPIEARLLHRVFHPNVDPNSGFVCLWDRFSAGDTVARALRQLQHIIAWSLVNVDARHVLQPEAVDWYNDSARDAALPLDFTPLVEPESLRLPKPFAVQSRRRLQPLTGEPSSLSLPHQGTK